MGEEEESFALRGKSVPVTEERAGGAIIGVLSALSGGDRQVEAYLLHLVCSSIGTAWMSGNRSEGAMPYAEEAREEVKRVYERIDLSLVALSPAQLLFLSGRLLYEAASRYGIPTEAKE